MDDIGSIFDQTISEVDSEEKRSRDECKKILQNKGIPEILDYIISIAKKNSTDQNDNEKKIIKELVTIARNYFYKNNKARLDEPTNFSLSEIESKKWYVYQIKINFGYTSSENYFWKNPSVNVLYISVNLSTKEISIGRADKEDRLYSESEDSKEVIAQKIIKFILTGIV